ncbi:MAG TPA: hypothetical protein VMN81_12370 [Vicinamibacterales bacterium]|nr:hypothetical protein [Vicinamibacterales bacterium]
MFLAPAREASAQMLSWTDRVFVNVSVGQQWMNQSLRTVGEFEIYEEFAKWDAPFDIDDSMLFDIGGGYRVWKNLALGAGFTRTTDTHDLTLTASIPDTLEFDRPHIETRSVTGLTREEKAFHLSATWMVPITDRLDIALSGGPSFFTVTQAYVNGMTVAAGTSALGDVTTASLEKSATGFHIAGDATVRIMRNFGVGFMARFSRAKIDTPELQGGSIEAGGFQGLVGARIRF